MREVLGSDLRTAHSWSEVTPDGYRIDVEIAEALQDRTEGLPVKLVEVALTIHWKKRMGEKSLSLRTLKTVDREVRTKVPGHA